MIYTNETTMDVAGRLVVPKAVREQAGLIPGMPLGIAFRDGRIEIEPLPREVRIVERDGFRVAEPVAPGEPLTGGAVKRARDGVRADRQRR